MSASSEPWGLLAAGIVVILIRVGVRWKTVGPRNWKVDDYVVMLVLVAWLLEAGVSSVIGKTHGMNNSLMTDEQRAALTPGSPLYDMREVGSKAMLGNIFIYTSILWGLKLCMTVFYGRLTHEIIDLTLRVRIAYLLLAVTYAIVVLTYLLGCHPFAGYWQINPDPGNSCYAVLSKVNILIVGIPNILTDIFLMSIPFPLIWRASLTTPRKVILCVLFSGGLFVVVATIVRMTTLLSGTVSGYKEGSIWTDREAFAAIMVTNTPVIYPVIAKFIESKSATVSSKLNASFGVNDSLGTKSSWTRMGDNGSQVHQSPGPHHDPYYHQHQQDIEMGSQHHPHGMPGEPQKMPPVYVQRTNPF